VAASQTLFTYNCFKINKTGTFNFRKYNEQNKLFGFYNYSKLTKFSKQYEIQP